MVEDCASARHLSKIRHWSIWQGFLCAFHHLLLAPRRILLLRAALVSFCCFFDCFIHSLISILVIYERSQKSSHFNIFFLFPFPMDFCHDSVSIDADSICFWTFRCISESIIMLTFSDLLLLSMYPIVVFADSFKMSVIVFHFCWLLIIL